MTHRDETEPPHGGSGWPGTVRAGIDHLSAILNVIGTLLIFGLVILVNADVAGRTFFLAPISGVPEIVSMSIVAIVFLQVAQAFRMGRFTRTDAFLSIIASRYPRVRAAIELVYGLAALALVWFLLSASYPMFRREWDRGTYVGTVGDFTFPAWPAKFIIVVGCVALILQLAVTVILATRALMGGTAEYDGRSANRGTRP
jgi:TRAP-type mannitol/chloroaromatic compound transport system permease small subunit